jgi:glycosyltransferase involved in cell wall biosynthesis
MKIVAISSFLWFGGAQIANLEFLELIRKFYPELELRVITCDKTSDELITLLNSMEIQVIRVPCGNISKYPLMNLKIAEDVISNADIIWIMDVEYNVIPSIKTYMKRKQRKVPIVTYLHSYALICPHWNAVYELTQICLKRCTLYRLVRCEQNINLKLFELGISSEMQHKAYGFIKSFFNLLRWKYFVNRHINDIDGFIAPSNEAWNIYINHMPELKYKPYTIVRNPVTEPLKYVKLNPNEPYNNYIVYASGSNIVKGPHILLEAWPELLKEFKDLKLYMIGCKDTWVETMARKKKLSNIVFFERLPANKYYYLLYKAKAVIMPSIWPETFGRIPIEANRLGTPAVVSSAGALPEIIVDGVTGYVFKAGDADDLAEKVAKVLEKDFNREKIIRHSYEKVDPQREVEKLIKFFENVIDYDGRI